MTPLPIQRVLKDSFGVEIAFYEWPVANSKAVVQIAHGLGEHARRYDHMAAVLNRQALAFTQTSTEAMVKLVLAK
jgi:alpha-beta hydrolase superfamily lysophospholipase